MVNHQSGSLFRLVLVFSFVMLLAGCGTNNYPFTPIGKGKVYKPGSVAVVAANEDQSTKVLAEFLTKELAERSSFNVMSQKEVAERLHEYPVTIKRISDKEVEEDDPAPVWYLPGEKSRIDAIQRKLKVDYVYLIWNRQIVAFHGRDSRRCVYPAGNLLEAPDGTVVGSTYSGACSSVSPLGMFRDKDYYIVDALHDGAINIANNFASSTKSRK